MKQIKVYNDKTEQYICTLKGFDIDELIEMSKKLRVCFEESVNRQF